MAIWASECRWACCERYAQLKFVIGNKQVMPTG